MPRKNVADARKLKRSRVADLPAAEPLSVLQQLLTQGLAPSTRKTMLDTLKHYEKTLIAACIAPFPLTPNSLLAYIAACPETRRPTTMRTRLYQLDLASRLAGWGSPLEDPLIKPYLETLRKFEHRPQRRTSLDDAMQISRLAPRARPMQRRNRALFHVVAFGGASLSEIARLDRSKVTRTKHGISLGFTDNSRPIRLDRGADPKTDPVSAVLEWLADIGTDPGPLFIVVRGRSEEFLHRAMPEHTVGRIFRELSSQILGVRLNPMVFIRGLVFALADKGCSMHEIMGRMRYVDPKSVLSKTGMRGKPYRAWLAVNARSDKPSKHDTHGEL